MSRRPRSRIESFCTSNSQDEEGHWMMTTYVKGMWVTMRPSTRGAHKISRRHIGLQCHHWKGRIVDLRQAPDGSKSVKVQHVYKASQLRMNEDERQRFPANYIFPSTFEEWEPLEALTGAFEAHHTEIGRLVYTGCSALELVQRAVFFYEAMYIVPMSRNSCGRLQAIPTPTLADPDWPIPDTSLVAYTARKIETDIKNAMKCTYGSHRASVTFFMPLHLFVFMFKAGEVHRTPTMWIGKGEKTFHQFLPQSWESKVVQHNGDTIKCSLVVDKVVVRYHIAKQQLSVTFPYRRWKRTGGEWEALDSDMTDVEQLDLHICVNNDVWDVSVNEDWTLLNLREYLALRYALKCEYTFLIGGNPVRKRKEKSFICEEIPFPRCIHVKPAISM